MSAHRLLPSDPWVPHVHTHDDKHKRDKTQMIRTGIELPGVHSVDMGYGHRTMKRGLGFAAHPVR